jgi:hypothetical protein
VAAIRARMVLTEQVHAEACRHVDRTPMQWRSAATWPVGWATVVSFAGLVRAIRSVRCGGRAGRVTGCLGFPLQGGEEVLGQGVGPRRQLRLIRLVGRGLSG